jgi:hemolysin activation/secretion protein
LRLARSLSGVCLIGCTFAAYAQQPPQAGEVLRDIQDRPQAPRLTPAPSIEVAPEKRRAVQPVPGLKVDVKAFRFSGATGVGEQRLQTVVQKFTGPGKTFEDLQAAADAVSEHLQQAGYFVAQAFLPEQKIADGIIEIAILLGQLGEVKLDIAPDVPVSRHVIDSTLASLPPGTILTAETVERALFLLSDLRGMQVRSIVEPGATPGTANLLVKVTPRKRVNGAIEFDRMGSRFTGDYRLGASFELSSPFGRGDLLSFRGLLSVPGGSEELKFGRLSYLSPVGSYGTKLGAAYSALNYHLGTSTFEPLDQGGRADVATVFALHPFVRARNLNVFGQAAFDIRDFHDDIRAVGLTIEKRTKVGTLGVVGDSRDPLLGGGINNFSLTLTGGDLDIKTPAVLAADQSPLGHQTQGNYYRLNGSFTRLNGLAESTVLFLSYAFQFASKNLDVSEKIGLGGPSAVRAYALGEASSDDAHLLTVELRYGLPRTIPVPGNVVLSAFYDLARGKLNHDPLPFEGPGNTKTLSGAGVGITWGREDDFLVRGSLAWRLSGRPVSDPDDKRPRLYFQASKYF